MFLTNNITGCSKCILLVALVFCHLFLNAQRIGNFSVSQSGNEIHYSFTYRAGVTCTGYQLMHSTDSLNFVAVDDYAGICGASGADEQFSGVHTKPKINAWNYYRIQTANFDLSEIRKLYVSADGQQKAIVFPNPLNSVNTTLSFRISGANNLNVQGFIFDAFGTERQFIDTYTNPDSAPIVTSALENGFYILWLTDGTNLYKGKFEILR